MRHRTAAIALTAILTVLPLAGCSGDAVVDVPESATVSLPPRATAAPSEQGSAGPAESIDSPGLDCALALPASAIEDATGLPGGSVTEEPAEGGHCSYAIAGNPAAVAVTLRPARLAETFAGEGEALGAVQAPLGEDAYWLEGEGPASASEFAVLASGYELHIVSYVGQRDDVVGWAVSVLASVGVELTVV